MEINKEQYASLLYSISAFEKALQNLDGPMSENPWYMTKATSSGQMYKQQLMAATGALSNLGFNTDFSMAPITNGAL
ncbi:hypothetical protein EAI89_02900 [Eubacterium sp. am_0171]|uniref:Uncharacterized protein n=1 Tax=Faecalicatena contorta TaxID=39482 RepID=A0A173ZU04_9FIRM|nr:MULTISPECIES: hypothetical protein [Clostridia]MSC82730.1 hypothetical protein [Eubacterium sp. BIOML-A1]MSD05124.1 hypothetical protein [Eubacterium sp. BIOML-A2]RYT25020.1 hypothetical protein EAI89_02900 [Eubacterium sp. am_0171]CUN78678.1 Uncharacterised protein [[Eubacterium] contortum] [Faecalicatena contorta]